MRLGRHGRGRRGARRAAEQAGATRVMLAAEQLHEASFFLSQPERRRDECCLLGAGDDHADDGYGAAAWGRPPPDGATEAPETAASAGFTPSSTAAFARAPALDLRRAGGECRARALASTVLARRRAAARRRRANLHVMATIAFSRARSLARGLTRGAVRPAEQRPRRATVAPRYPTRRDPIHMQGAGRAPSPRAVLGDRASGKAVDAASVSSIRGDPEGLEPRRADEQEEKVEKASLRSRRPRAPAAGSRRAACR